MIIEIRIVPKEQTRFKDLYVGDYYYEGDKVIITAVDTGNKVRDRIVALHELVEFIITDYKGITEEEILEFDKMFEQETKEGQHNPDDEPGDDHRAPYIIAHQFSTIIEQLVLNHLNIFRDDKKVWH
jgi:hypothetical protein